MLIPESGRGNNPAKNELDQIANRELSGVIAQHRINLFNDLGLASHGLKGRLIINCQGLLQSSIGVS